MSTSRRTLERSKTVGMFTVFLYKTSTSIAFDKNHTGVYDIEVSDGCTRYFSDMALPWYPIESYMQFKGVIKHIKKVCRIPFRDLPLHVNSDILTRFVVLQRLEHEVPVGSFWRRDLLWNWSYVH